MKVYAFLCWAVSVLCILFTATFSIGSIESGPVGATSIEIVGFFDGITFVGALVYGAIFAFFVAGCVFWAGYLVKRA